MKRWFLIAAILLLVVTKSFSLTSKVYPIKYEGGELEELLYIIELGNEKDEDVNVVFDLSQLSIWRPEVKEEIIIVPAKEKVNVTLKLYPSKVAIDRCVLSKSFCDLNLSLYAYVDEERKKIALVPVKVKIEYLPVLATITSLTFPSKVDVREKANLEVLIDNERETGYVKIKTLINNGEILNETNTILVVSGANKFSKDIQLTLLPPGNYLLDVYIYYDSKLLDHYQKQFEIIGFSDINYSIKEDFGLITRKIIIEVSNDGNTEGTFSYTLPLSFFDKLFITKVINGEVTKKGVNINLVVGSGEKKKIVVEFNYLPLLLVPVAVLIALAIYYFLILKKVSIKKEIVKIEERDGEKRITVAITIKSLKGVIENVKVIEKLPEIASQVGKFQTLKGEVNKKEKKITWEIEKISKGEEVLINYTFKIKLSIIGRVPMPETIVEYVENGVKKIEKSNKVYIEFK